MTDNTQKNELLRIAIGNISYNYKQGVPATKVADRIYALYQELYPEDKF